MINHHVRIKKREMGLFAGALLLRLLVLFFYPDQNFGDANSYLNSARYLLSHGVYTLDFHMPLYVLWTALWNNITLIKLADCVVSSVSVVLIYQLVSDVFKQKSMALIAAIIASVYPHFLFYATSRLTEPLYITLILAAFLCLYRQYFFWGSVLLTLGVLTRPTLDLLNPILIFIFAYVVHDLPLKTCLKKLGIFALTYTTLMTPWWMYNYHRYDHFVRLNVGEGFGLYSGNNPLNTSGGGVVDPDQNAQDLSLNVCEHVTNKYEFDKCLKNEAIDYIKNNPAKTVKLMGVKFLRFWRLWPYTPHYNSYIYIVISLLSYGLVLLFALLALTKLSKRQWQKLTPIFALAAYMTAVHMVLISSTRYRLPLEPFLIILASFYLTPLLTGFLDRKPGAFDGTA